MTNKFKFNPNIFLYILAAFMLLLLILGLYGCNNKIPLRHYKKVAADVLPFDNEQKKNIIAQKCASAFPIEEKIVIKDTVITKYVKTQDYSQINKLKALLAKCSTPIDLDSFLFYNMITDTIYIDRVRTEHKTVRDTINNYFKDLSSEQIKAENIGLKVLQKNTNDNYLEAKRTNDKWRLRFYVLLTFVLLYVGLRVLSLFRTLPIKL